MNGFQSWLNQLQYEKMLEILIAVAAGLISITVHEVSHGAAAYMMGDDTAKRSGRLTLNPIRHLDLMGMLCMLVVHFGWAKPVPVNFKRFRNVRAGTIVTSLAGPVSNILLCFLSIYLYMVLQLVGISHTLPLWVGYVSYFLWYMVILNATLAVFNLIPVPPLDGSKILFSFLPEEKFFWILRYERYGFLVMAVLLYTGILDGPIGWMRDGLIHTLQTICWWLLPV